MIMIGGAIGLVAGIFLLLIGLDWRLNIYKIAENQNHPYYREALDIVFTAGGGEVFKRKAFVLIVVSLPLMVLGAFAVFCMS